VLRKTLRISAVLVRFASKRTDVWKPPLQPIIAKDPRERCQFDLIQLPIDLEICNQYVLNVITKFLWSFPLKTIQVRIDVMKVKRREEKRREEKRREEKRREEKGGEEKRR
jgi:hypothetical protein